MTVTFSRYELPIAYSFIAAAKRQKPRRDGSHPFEEYFCFWTAFNNIYTTIAFSENRSTTLKKRADGSIETKTNGSVQIPRVKTVSEPEQIALAFAEFDGDLRHRLVAHPSTASSRGVHLHGMGTQSRLTLQVNGSMAFSM